MSPTQIIPFGQKKLKEEVPALVDSIKVIFEVSEYFNTNERITSLFVKVTNKLVSASRQFLYAGVDKIWDHPRFELPSMPRDRPDIFCP